MLKCLSCPTDKMPRAIYVAHTNDLARPETIQSAMDKIRQYKGVSKVSVGRGIEMGPSLIIEAYGDVPDLERLNLHLRMVDGVKIVSGQILGE